MWWIDKKSPRLTLVGSPGKNNNNNSDGVLTRLTGGFSGSPRTKAEMKNIKIIEEKKEDPRGSAIVRFILFKNLQKTYS